MWFPIPAIWIAQGMSATAAGADRLGGHLVEEATRAQVDGAEDRPPPVGARRHHLLAGAAGDPGGPHPGQQVEVGLVLGQHHRPSGSPAMAWRRSASTCSRSGSPLATRRGRRQQATCRTRRRSVRWLRRVGQAAATAGRSSRPWAGPATSGCAGAGGGCPAVAGQLGAGRPARWCRGGCSGGPRGAPWPGSQPNSSAMAAADRPWWDSRIMTRRKAVRCGRWSRLSRWQGQAAGQEGLASTLWGGRILQAASSGRLCCGRLQRPARLLHLVGPHRRLRAEPLTIRLGCSSSPGLRVGAAQWGCTAAPAPATATPQVAAGRGSGPFPQRVGDRTDAGRWDLAEHQ